MSGTLHIARLAFATALRRIALPGTAAVAAAWYGVGRIPPVTAGGLDVDADARLWLQLPACVVAFVAIVSTLDAWPLLSRDRLGAPTLQRLRPRGADGTLAAVGGGLCAALLGLVLAALGFHAALTAQRPSSDAGVAAHVRYRAGGDAVLTQPGQRLALRSAAPTTEVGALELRPLALLGPDRARSAVALLAYADGEPLHDRPVAIDSSHAVTTIDFEARALTELELELHGERGLWLAFPPGAVQGISAHRHAAATNAILAALSYLVPAAVALLAAAALRRTLSFGVATAAGAILVACAAALPQSPTAVAVSAYAARRWVPAEDAGQAWIAAAAVGLMGAAAILTGRRG